MKLNEKWTLFLLATFVTFFGITNTLLKGTESTSETDSKTSYTSNYSDSDLSNIILSEGIIDFNPEVTEYNIKVSDFETLEVIPVLASDTSQYTLSKNLGLDGKYNIVITVNSKDGDIKIYTLYVEEINS